MFLQDYKLIFMWKTLIIIIIIKMIRTLLPKVKDDSCKHFYIVLKKSKSKKSHFYISHYKPFIRFKLLYFVNVFLMTNNNNQRGILSLSLSLWGTHDVNDLTRTSSKIKRYVHTGQTSAILHSIQNASCNLRGFELVRVLQPHQSDCSTVEILVGWEFQVAPRIRDVRDEGLADILGYQFLDFFPIGGQPFHQQISIYRIR